MLPDVKCKCILVGSTMTGKTCIIQRLITDTFNGDQMSSMNYSNIDYNLEINDLSVQMSIWDTVGQEKYSTMNKSFYQGSDIAILTYSIIERRSFEELKTKWLPQIRDNTKKDIILCVAGNKSDSYLQEEVNEKEGKEFAKNIGASFILTSALSGAGINELFKMAAEKFIDKTNRNETPSSDQGRKTLDQATKGNQEKKDCC